MSRPETKGFQKPLLSGKTQPVGIAMITDDPAGAIVCNCGWAKAHRRKKVREDSAERHLKSKHGGIGVWL